jgi:hypothetical protein
MSIAVWIAIFVCGAVALCVIWACLAWSGALRKKYRGGPHYFSSFGITFAPIRLHTPISSTEAQARETEGGVYYIGHFDDSGNPRTVEKRRNGSRDFKYDYTYRNGRLTEYTYLKDGRPGYVQVPERRPWWKWIRT